MPAAAALARVSAAQPIQADNRSEGVPAFRFRILFPKVIRDGSRPIIFNRVQPTPMLFRPAPRALADFASSGFRAFLFLLEGGRGGDQVCVERELDSSSF